ncbi:predicted GPI-anchored protein 58 [Phragmites australis]|uniref:predicted GPI-anchored protein 58 n=1 Tax=Phragmites australis TaxID=29695 RepID=UPI002D79AC63|nr:predicted GPI-anchored protein 58 [Phragmites australis]
MNAQIAKEMVMQGVVVSSSKSPAAPVLEVSFSAAPNVTTSTSVSTTVPTPAPVSKNLVVATAPTPAPSVSAPTLEDPVVATAPTPAPAISAPTPEDPVVAPAPTSFARPLSPDFDALSASNEAEHKSGSSFGSKFEVCPFITTATPPSSPALDAKEVDI